MVKLPPPDTLEGILHFYSETGTEGGHWAFQDAQHIKKKPGYEEQWSYEGLHILRDGDYLIIYHPQKKDQEIWSGVIALERYDLFSQDASGMWIHADQKGIAREVWAKYFFEEYPAKLLPFRR